MSSASGTHHLRRALRANEQAVAVAADVLNASSKAILNLELNLFAGRRLFERRRLVASVAAHHMLVQFAAAVDRVVADFALDDWDAPGHHIREGDFEALVDGLVGRRRRV